MLPAGADTGQGSMTQLLSWYAYRSTANEPSAAGLPNVHTHTLPSTAASSSLLLPHPGAPRVSGRGDRVGASGVQPHAHPFHGAGLGQHQHQHQVQGLPSCIAVIPDGGITVSPASMTLPSLSLPHNATAAAAAAPWQGAMAHHHKASAGHPHPHMQPHLPAVREAGSRLEEAGEGDDEHGGWE